MKKEKSIKGIALLVSLIFAVVLGIGAVAVAKLHSTEIRLVRRQNNSTRAFYFAEAGLSRAVWYLKGIDPNGSAGGSWRTTPYPASPGSSPGDPRQENLSNAYAGTYTIWVQDSGSNVSIYSRGTVGGITRVVTQSIVISTVPGVFDYALNVGGNINSAEATYFTVIPEGSQQEETTVPTLDLSYYQAMADHTISGNKTFTAGTYGTSFDPEIWYVDGNITIESNVTINGSVIATGNVDMKGHSNITINATALYPALAADGNFLFQDSTDIIVNGLIYVGADMAGNLLLQGTENITFTGAVIIAGNFNLQQSDTVTISYDESMIGNPPPGFVDITPNDDWKEI